METAFTIILLVLVLLFYLSNPHNQVNKWCALAGLLFWLGIAKEAVLYNIIPALRNVQDVNRLRDGFMPVYSVCTWALYSLAMPTTLIFALYFCNWERNHPAHLRLAKVALYVPALIASFFFPPLDFRAYQLGSAPFWTTYAVLNLGFTAVFALLMTLGIRMERPGMLKAQKKRVRMIILPPVLFWATSVFLTHPFALSGLFKLWQINAFILLISLLVFIVMAFRDGFMGLKLSGETYSWSSDIHIINTGAEYTSHMLKNQTVKMDLCIEHLKSMFVLQDGEDMPEEFAILSRSIATLKTYVDKIKRHSQNIRLAEEPCSLPELLTNAMPMHLNNPQGVIAVRIDLPEQMIWVCDKNHMTEVFANVLINAAEAICGSGTITISGAFDKRERNYLVSVTDTGTGMDENELRQIFKPYFTTKSTEKNFGLGLAYCKNVMIKHGGGITATSKPGKGTTVTISISSRKVAMGEDEVNRL